ncbi:cobalamin-5-phosphate synthase CobS [Thermodesulfatator indicus DSM 15286]|uniref:Adenosylcobinamide-GDP ribazoletransferase n=1 Tax=Thermodesulfatator indicus (strain DSM 15286 / JCM 11887 / CIR29812) TaxID=667014 RepID=F8ABZ9_THEID|nr:adenosylcobinamide-GDP ribazoletransferase [Thermodesulfatator indicus]AEH45697.1 cobalamin-5-phosphate synthase CobS [Thermodesulfatator indicus DSM 15286]
MLKKEWQAFLSAVSFFTRIPLTPKEFSLELGVFYLPLIGLFLGGLFFLLALLLISYLPSVYLALLLMAIKYYLADFFHFDGLLDWADAMAAGGDISRRLEVLKKPEIGVGAFLFGFFFLLGEFLLTKDLLEKGLLLVILWMPVAGRLASSLIALFLEPAKKEGLGFLFLSGSRKRLWLSHIFGLPLFCLYPLPTLAVLLLVLCLRFSFRKNFGGLSGDLLGATLMLAEWIFVAVSLISTKIPA